MRLLLVVVLLAILVLPAHTAELITVDPNTPSAAINAPKPDSDQRLAQKVTYQARHKLVSEVLSDLSAITGVTFHAGYNSRDWQVRDRRMNIFARDITLADLMSSIARTMKFKWSIDDDQDPTTYRLYMDRRTLLEEEGRKYRQEQQRQQQMDQHRREAVESISKLADATPEEIAQMRENDPTGYMLTATGIARPFSQLMQSCPQIRDGLMNGEEMTLSAGTLSPRALTALLDSMRAIWTMNERTRTAIRPPNRDGSMGDPLPLPDDIGDKLGKVRIKLKPNTDFASPNPFELIELATVEVRFYQDYTRDGGSYGIDNRVQLPILDPSNPLTKAVGSLYVKMIDEGPHALDGGFSIPISPDQMNPSDYGETQVKHSQDDPDPALAAEVELMNDDQPDGQDLPDAVQARKAYEDTLAALAESAGLSVVADSYNDYTKVSMGSDKLSAEQILDSLSTLHKLNWWKRDSAIELRDRFWFRKRSAQIPEKTLQGWRTRFVETGYMDIDDLAGLCSLTKEQFDQNIRGDETLDQIMVTGAWSQYKGAAALYTALDSNQQQALKNGTPIELSSLSDTQWPAVEKAILHKAPAFFDQHDSRDCSLLCKSEMTGGAPRYTIQVVETQTSEPAGASWSVAAPRYQKPKSAEEKE